MKECFCTPNGELHPEYGPCDVCAVVGCYPLRHERLANDAQALRFARIVARDGSETPRAQMLADWVVAELTRRKRG